MCCVCVCAVCVCAVFLKTRDRVIWDGLVDEVFKDELDQFMIESGVQGLCIRQKSDIWNRSQSSSSTSLTWPSPILVPSLGLVRVRTDSANQYSGSSDGQSRGLEKYSISQESHDDHSVRRPISHSSPLVPISNTFETCKSK